MSDPAVENRTKEEHGVAAVLNDALENVSTLVRDEVDLARAEVSENLSRAGAAMGVLAGAAILGVVGLIMLAEAAATALMALGLTAAWASLVVGVVLGIVALIMMSVGRRRLQLASIAPTRTARNVKRDARVVKEAYHDK